MSFLNYQTYRADLFIVYAQDIVVVEGEYKVLSSKTNLIENWLPKDQDLEALSFSYVVKETDKK